MLRKQSKKIWNFENQFYHTSDNSRLNKLVYHYEIVKKIYPVKGDFFEFGVFKGLSFIRFLTFSKLIDRQKRTFYGFDTFGKFPKQKNKFDKKFVKFWSKYAGDSLEKKKLDKILKKKKLYNYKLIKGNIFNTLEDFLKTYSKKIALLHLDLDTYEVTKYVIYRLSSHLQKGSIILCDDYKSTIGATKAINEFLKSKRKKIKRIPGHKNPYYIEI